MLVIHVDQVVPTERSEKDGKRVRQGLITVANNRGPGWGGKVGETKEEKAKEIAKEEIAKEIAA